MFKLYYEKRLNKKGDAYFDVIYADLGYRQIFLTFDRSVIAELLGKSVSELYSVEGGYKLEIGDIDGSLLGVK